MKAELKKPCAQCPFRTKSFPGWLGPHTAESLANLVFVQEAPFPCHVSMGDFGDDTPEEDYQLCQGSVMSMSKSMKLPRDPEMRKLVEAVDKKKTRDILTKNEFVTYHTPDWNAEED